MHENQEGSTVLLAFACFCLLCWCGCLSEGPSGKEGLHLRVSSLFLKPSGKEGLRLRLSSWLCRFVSLVVGWGVLHLGVAQGFVLSLVRVCGWCLHLALPRRIRNARLCFSFGVCPRLAVGRRSLDDKIMLGFAVLGGAKLVASCL